MAIGTWETTYDPSVYGNLTLNMDEAIAYQEAFRAQTGKRVTLSHMMAKAVAAVLQATPEANAILRFNRIYLRKRIGVFFQVALEDDNGEIDLSGATIYDPEQKSLVEIIDEFASKVGHVRTGRDNRFSKSRNLLRRVPSLSLNPVLKTLGLLSYGLNLDLRWAGIPRDPFGSVMITNIGSIGLRQAYVPLVPYSRVPLVIAMGAVETRPVVKHNQVVPGKVMDVCATFDHRVLDGMHATVMAKTLRSWMEHPWDHFDELTL